MERKVWSSIYLVWMGIPEFQSRVSVDPEGTGKEERCLSSGGPVKIRKG